MGSKEQSGLILVVLDCMYLSSLSEPVGETIYALDCSFGSRSSVSELVQVVTLYVISKKKVESAAHAKLRVLRILVLV